MRIRSARFLALVLAIGVAAPLFAQRQGRGGMGGGITAAMLVSQKSVQEELKLSPDEVTKITDKTKELRTKYADDFKDKDKRADAMKKMNEESNKIVAECLKPEQLKRLHQIEIQLGGLTALQKEDVQKKLKLSDKQVSDVKGLADDLAKDSAELLKGGFKDQAKMKENREKIQALNKEATAKFISGLSAEQKTAYKELIGDEFKGQITFGMGRRPNQDKE